MGLFAKKHAPAPRPQAAPAAQEIDLGKLAPEAWTAYESAASAVAGHAAKLSAIRGEVAGIEATVARLESEASACRAAHEARTRARLSGQPIPPETGRTHRDVNADLEMAMLDLGVARAVLAETDEATADVDDRAAVAFRRVLRVASEALTAEALALAGDRLTHAYALKQRADPRIDGELFHEFVGRVWTEGRQRPPLPAGVPVVPASTAAPGGVRDIGFELCDDGDDADVAAGF
jgi:hypothetical protein